MSPADRARAAAFAMLAAACLSGCGPGSLAYDLWRGTKDYREGEYGKSFERFSNAQHARPNDPRPSFDAGDAQYKLGQFDEAKERFSALAGAEKNPRRLRRDAFYNLGDAHFQQKEYKEAAEAYKRCLLLDPSDNDCRFNLVRTLAVLKPPSSKKQPQPDKKNRRNKDEKSGGQDQQPPNSDKSRPQSEMSREDAERIMQSVREKEKGAPLPEPAWQKKPARPAGEQGVDW